MVILHGRIEIVSGDITEQRVAAVVNAANSSLLGGGGVDGAIHRAAGPLLYEECRLLNGCATGEAKVTRGHKLPARLIFHTVGPIWKDGKRGEEEKLAKCYRSCFAQAVKNEVKTIAFPAISTGAYAFPPDLAARIALSEACRFLENDQTIKKVTFVCFGDRSQAIYEKAASEVFS
jgi:O-acetyl-ADP-ribose deacetylase